MRYLAVTWALVAVFCAALAVVGPTIDDHSTERAQADALQDAIRASQAAARFAKAAAKACGINAGWIEVEQGVIRCTLHTGKKTDRYAMVRP